MTFQIFYLLKLFLADSTSSESSCDAPNYTCLQTPYHIHYKLGQPSFLWAVSRALFPCVASENLRVGYCLGHLPSRSELNYGIGHWATLRHHHWLKICGVSFNHRVFVLWNICTFCHNPQKNTTTSTTQPQPCSLAGHENNCASPSPLTKSMVALRCIWLTFIDHI